MLADYVGGALDGTPEQVRVARLVEEDPAWGGAYAALAPAVELVRADLADWAAAAVPDMPLTLAVRCPRCGSPETEQVSRFGSTACKALWR
ncbi:hypothetical protein JNW87_28395, partial [Micromonospora sp. ATA51]|nr:hypothetical protein [Micromonospora sp. ATA51]